MSTSPAQSPLPTAWAAIGRSAVTRVTRSKKTRVPRVMVLPMPTWKGLLLPSPKDGDLLRSKGLFATEFISLTVSSREAQQIELTALVHLKLCKSLRHIITRYPASSLARPTAVPRAFLLPSLEIRRWPCVSPTETKILRSKVELAFRLSFPVIPSEAEEWSSWENRDIYGKTELSEQGVSESILSTLVFLCQKTARSFQAVLHCAFHTGLYSRLS